MADVTNPIIHFDFFFEIHIIFEFYFILDRGVDAWRGESLFVIVQIPANLLVLVVLAVAIILIVIVGQHEEHIV
jgi:hypothetical protein